MNLRTRCASIPLDRQTCLSLGPGSPRAVIAIRIVVVRWLLILPLSSTLRACLRALYAVDPETVAGFPDTCSGIS